MCIRDRVNWGLKSRNESLVTVRCRGRKRDYSGRVFQKPTNVVTRHLRKTCVTIAGEQRLVALPKRLVTVHSRTIVAVERFRHEGRRLANLKCSIADYVFEHLEIIGSSQHRGIPKVDFALAGGSNFMMMAFGVDSTLEQGQ